MRPDRILRIEGVAVFLGATSAYLHLDGSLWLYVLLFFAPDLGMVGYLAGPSAGSRTYNIVHTYVLPLVLFSLGTWLAVGPATLVAAVWIAHIGFDRALGYGLKFPTAFAKTHLDPDRFAITEESIEERRVEPAFDNA